MQKNYREFTVGELLDLGLDVEIKKHGIYSLDDGKEIIRMFEGTKQSTNKTPRITLANAWKGKFNVTVFIDEKSK